MIEYSLDTNACIAVINGTSPALRTMIAEAIGEGSVLRVSTAVLHELWFGAAKSARAAYNAERIQAFLAGPLEVRLSFATTGTDADWIVKLIDVYPEDYPPDFKLGGYQLMVANDVLRGRFHKSFERPVPLIPNGVIPFTVDLHTQSYRFQRGHKIMVQVQSTWFPLIDRNPQTWVPNIFEAQASDYRPQTHRIWRTPARPSRVDIQTVAE